MIFEWQMGLAFIVGLAFLPCFSLLFKMFTIEVEDETAVILSRFGKLLRTVREPGLHFWPEKILPWTKATSISIKRNFRHYEEINVNDRRGTTVIIDLWIEFSVVSPEKVLFQVENSERALQSLLTN